MDKSRNMTDGGKQFQQTNGPKLNQSQFKNNSSKPKRTIFQPYYSLEKLQNGLKRQELIQVRFLEI